MEVCSLDVAQPFATVCVIGCAYRKFYRRVICGGFKRHAASFRVAGVALRGIWTCLVTYGKSFCVAGAILLILLRRFPNMSCIFRGRRSTLDVSSCILRGRRSISEVSC